GKAQTEQSLVFVDRASINLPIITFQSEILHLKYEMNWESRCVLRELFFQCRGPVCHQRNGWSLFFNRNRHQQPLAIFRDSEATIVWQDFVHEKGVALTKLESAAAVG